MPEPKENPPVQFQIPESMQGPDAEKRIASLWETWNSKLKEAPDPQAYRNAMAQKHELFGQFNAIHEMGADLTLESDVEVPPDSRGVSSALRLVGAGGQLVGMFGGPLTTGAMTGFNALMNAGANVVDEQSGIPSTAMPITQLVSDLMGGETQFTTGDPILDAAVEGVGDLFLGAGVIGKMGASIKRTLSPTPKNIAQEYIAKQLKDADFMKDFVELGAEEHIPLVLKQHGVGGGVVDAISTVIAGSKEQDQLTREVAEGLEATWRQAFKQETTDPATLRTLIENFQEGSSLARKLGEGNLLPGDVDSIRAMVSLNRGREGTLRTLTGLRKNFEASKPRISFGPETAKNLKAAVKLLDDINLADDKSVTGLAKALTNIRDKAVGLVEVKGKLPDVIQDSSKVLETLNAIDEQILKAEKYLPPAQAGEVGQRLSKLRDSMEMDILTNLTTEQQKIFQSFIKGRKEFNALPTKIVEASNVGDITGFMETLVRNPKAARMLKEGNIFTQREASSIVGEHLLSKGKKILKDGSEAVDFVKIQKYVDNPENRQGIVEMMGSENLGIFRQFINVAANVAPTSSTGSFARRMLLYSPLASGFVIHDPTQILATTGALYGIGIATNQMLKKILFNRELGSKALEMLKMGDNTPAARRAFNQVMAALNGTEATAMFLNPNGEPIVSENIVIRQGPGGKPSFQKQQ